MNTQRRLVRSLIPASISCVVVVLAGCETLDIPPNADVAAVTTIVKDVYSQEGQGRVIFLDVDHDGSVLGECISLLEAELQTKVLPVSETAIAEDGDLPPLTRIDPRTGEAGFVITLGEFTIDDQGYLRIAVSFARSGLDGAILEYILEPTVVGWAIVAVRRIAVA